ncbi:MAG: oligosaccharide flippase family protein [Terriglobales bacterium]
MMAVLAGGALLGSLAVLAAIWVGYPAAVALWAKLRPYRLRATPLDAPAGDWPRVSVIVAAYNEAEHMAARIANLRAQDYPTERLEILVCEDGSTDRTLAVLEALEPAAVPVGVLSAPHRMGKAAALNRGAAAARGEILVFTDANNSFAPQALRHLVAPFADAGVGAVTGRKTVAERHGMGGGEGVYWRYEGWLTARESAAGGTATAFGEALAVRRSLFRPLPTEVLINDDLFLGLAVLVQRRRLLVAPHGLSWEMGSADAGSEWERRRHAAVGLLAALTSVRRQVGRLSPSDALKLAFHHILRSTSALWVLLALLAALTLAAAPAPAALHVLAAVVLAGFAWSGIGALTHRFGLRLGRAEAPYFFCLAVAAAAVGIFCGWRRSEPAQWRRVKRAVAPPPIIEPDAASAPSPGAPAHCGGILNGLLWASSSFLLGKLLVFGSVVALARILAPKAFGEVALATSTVIVLEILGTFGLTSALIFEERAAEAAANICFWITLGTSFLEFAAAWLLAPWLALFFREPALAGMIRGLSISLPLLALGNTHDFVLRRRLAFRTKFLPDIGQAFIKGLAAIVLALLGFGAWSLIWGQVLGTIAATGLLWAVVPWRPHRGWDGEVFWRMVRYAKHIYFLDGSSVLLANLDNVTIGRMLSDTLLGFYTLAFRLPEVILLSVLNVVTRVTFPGFSRLQHDPAQMRRTLLDTARYTTLLTLPLAAGMGVLAPAVIYGIYGKDWGPSIPVLEVLALYGGIRCLIHSFGDGYKAVGRPDVLTRTTTLWWIVLPPSLILGARWGGIVGVAWGEVICRTAMTMLHVYLVNRYLRIRPAALLRCFAPALEGTAIMTAALWLALPLARGLAPRVELAALVPFGAAVYFAAIFLLHPPVARLTLQHLRPARRAGAQAAAPASEVAA